MFGFDETIEYRQSPADEIKELTQQGIDYIHKRPKFGGKDLDGFLKIADAICAKANELSPEEKGKISLYLASLSSWKPTAMQMAKVPGGVFETYFQSFSPILADNWLPAIINGLS